VNTLLWVLGIGAALMVAANWKTCSAGVGQVFDVNGRAITDVNGNLLVTPNPCGASLPCHVVANTRVPPMSCLFNPFPGGL
jgi:hypothetical protein